VHMIKKKLYLVFSGEKAKTNFPISEYILDDAQIPRAHIPQSTTPLNNCEISGCRSSCCWRRLF
jgi:hypothetical protein